MDKQEIRARVGKIQWFHDYELVPGVMTHGISDMSERAPYFQIPQDLSGKRVLDIGCADGYFTFLAESRGASVVAVDSWPRQGFFLTREVLQSKVEFHHMSVYDIHPDKLGMFDIVFFFGVYYHLKNPLLALERVASVTRELAIIESEVMGSRRLEGKSLSRFCEFGELNDDTSNWWVPDVPCLVRTVRAAGFPRTKFVSRYANRAVVHAYKGPRSAGKMLTENFFITIDTPLANAQVKETVSISGWVLNQLEPGKGIARITIYLDNLDDPASELGQAEYGIPRKDLSPCVSPIYGNVGFQFTWHTSGATPGRHTLYVLVEGKDGWHYDFVPIIIGSSEMNQDFSASAQVPDAPVKQDQAHRAISDLEHALAVRDAEIMRLQKLADGYERGHFIQLMKWLSSLRR